MTEQLSGTSGPESRFPPDDLRVDFGAPSPGSSNPMPDEIRAAYEARILASIEAQAQGARLARQLWVG